MPRKSVGQTGEKPFKYVNPCGFDIDPSKGPGEA